MDEHTCEAKPPRINRHVGSKKKYRWTQAAYACVELVEPGHGRVGLVPIVVPCTPLTVNPHNFINFNNISNILRHLYGITHLITETTP